MSMAKAAGFRITDLANKKSLCSAYYYVTMASDLIVPRLVFLSHKDV